MRTWLILVAVYVAYCGLLWMGVLALTRWLIRRAK